MYPRNVGGKWPAERWGLYDILKENLEDEKS